MAFRPAGRRTRTGTAESRVVPLPSWPSGLLPQQYARPSRRRAQVWDFPWVTSIARALAGRRTATGTTEYIAVVAPPSVWLELSPQQKTLPPASTTQLENGPALTSAMRLPAGRRTATGTGESVLC